MLSSFQNREYTRGSLSGTIPPAMARMVNPESIEATGNRLRVTREALGLSQAEICRQTGIRPAAWNNAETGDNRLKIENVLILCRRYGLTTDWLLRGDIRGIPGEFAKKIAEVEARPIAKRA